MSGFRKLAKDAALLTCSAVFMRCAAMAYQVWLAGRIGAAGMGLWQLVLSVNVFTATLAISGIRFTTTRLVAEEAAAGSRSGIRSAVAHALGYAAVFGFGAFLLQFCFAEAIGFLWIGDARTVQSLRTLAWSLPMISLSCVFGGYFIATGRAVVSAAVQAAEQLAGVGCVVFLLRGTRTGELSDCCAAIARGNVAADLFSLVLASLLYLRFRSRSPASAASASPPPEEGRRLGAIPGRLLRLALPLALSAYARTGLSALENLLVPQKLRAAGFSAERALGGYGIISGMVLPMVGFPACLLAAVAELTVPELTAAQVRGDGARIRRTVSRLLGLALGYALLVSAFFLVCAEPLGMLVYHTEGVGGYLRLFSLLVPFLYVDMITDGCLKGLGQMLWSMVFNVAESLAGVALVVLLLPRWGLKGYLFVLFFCEIFNFSLSLLRLRAVVWPSREGLFRFSPAGAPGSPPAPESFP